MDAQTRIAGVLLDHRVVDLEHTTTDGDVIECRCGWFYTPEDHAAHAAQVLSTTPGLGL